MNPYVAILPYAVVAVGMLLSLWLFAQLKTDIQRVARRGHADAAAVAAACRELREVLGRMPAAPEPKQAPGRPVAEAMARRAQILRLLRGGERPERVAAVLGVPLPEILEASSRAARAGA